MIRVPGVEARRAVKLLGQHDAHEAVRQRHRRQRHPRRGAAPEAGVEAVRTADDERDVGGGNAPLLQIIGELEPQKRGLYAGAIGYFGYNGNLDTCIVIRTIVMKGKKVFITAGAGIVADSDPKMEYQETLNKARAMLKAVELAEQWRKR